MNKVVLITGGARGIGSAIALELAKHGYDIVINYLTSKQPAKELKENNVKLVEIQRSRGYAHRLSLTISKLERIIKKIREVNKDVIIMVDNCYGELVEKLEPGHICADVSDVDQVNIMVSEIEEKMGGVDVLINNAAVDLSNLFHLKNAEEFKRTLDVNVVGAFNCSKRVYKHMLDQEYGRIINISSTNGINTYYPMCIDYDASKAALISMTHNLAAEFGPYINVNCVAPGFIGTDNELDGYDEEFLKEETEKIMVKRYGKPEEVAYLVRFLISDEANFINNSIIRIDGGQMGSC